MKRSIIFLFFALLFSGCFAQINAVNPNQSRLEPPKRTYYFKGLNFEFLGRQNVEILSDDRIVPARSQFGFAGDLIYSPYNDLHPETILGYRQVNLSNIDSIGARKHHDVYIMIGARFLPINGQVMRPTLSASAGLSFRGASFADQIAFDMVLRGGLAYSFGKEEWQRDNSFLMFECVYRPIGSDAIGGIELLPSYMFSVSLVMLFFEEEK